ncbi:MAG: hypothetical protein ABWX92_07100 [Mycetocola sp.]
MSEPVNETGQVKAIVKALRKEWPDIYIWKVHGGEYQESGIPDLCICLRGLYIAIEVKHKRPGESETHARERATDLQRIQIARTNKAGGMAGVALNPQEALDICRRAFEKDEARRA